MKQPAEEIDAELSKWEDMLGIDSDERPRERRPLTEDTYSRWDVDADDRVTPTHEELDAEFDGTLEYEIDEDGRVTYTHDLGFWEAVKLTFDSDSYLSTSSKALIAGTYGFLFIGVPLLAWGFAKGMTSLVGGSLAWYGLALVALAVFYIRWAAKVLSA